jgi:hypothetical protein
VTTTGKYSNDELGREAIDRAFKLLAVRLEENCADAIEIAICGGSALIFSGLVVRTTKDVDVVALVRDGRIFTPAPLPGHLMQASREVAEDLGLDPHWLNNEPSRAEGGLFQMGLPKGFGERLTAVSYGDKLTVHFASRFDQIHFKLYASVDRGGYHIEDLLALSPTEEELVAAAKWCMTHDVSAGFRMLLKKLLEGLNHENAADRI